MVTQMHPKMVKLLSFVNASYSLLYSRSIHPRRVIYTRLPFLRVFNLFVNINAVVTFLIAVAKCLGVQPIMAENGLKQKEIEGHIAPVVMKADAQSTFSFIRSKSPAHRCVPHHLTKSRNPIKDMSRNLCPR